MTKLKNYGFKTADELLNIHPIGIYSEYSYGKFYLDGSYILVKDNGKIFMFILEEETLNDILDLKDDGVLERVDD